jgi:dihydroorotase-like cyclic amidohydrolase
VARLCSEHPARRFGQYPTKGAIRVGSDADLTIVDMDRQNTFKSPDMASKSGHSSWDGLSTQGMPTHTIVRGTVVMEEEAVLIEPGFGQFLPGTAARAPQPPLAAPEAAVSVSERTS